VSTGERGRGLLRAIIDLHDMEVTQNTNNTRPASTAEPVYLENTLLRVFGVLFCHDAKRARQRTGTIAINRGVKEKNIVVRIDPEYAQPGPFAHKVAVDGVGQCRRVGGEIVLRLDEQPALVLGIVDDELAMARCGDIGEAVGDAEHGVVAS
jgi:hypothetical protein